MKMLGIVGSLLCACIAALFAAIPSGELDDGEIQRMRGRDAYYARPLEEHGLDLVVGLADSGQSMMFKTRIVYQFQRGLECKDAQPLIDHNQARLQDSLILYFSGRTRMDILGEKARRGLRRDLMRIIEADLFPDGEARVRDVLFPLWQFQRVRGS